MKSNTEYLVYVMYNLEMPSLCIEKPRVSLYIDLH